HPHSTLDDAQYLAIVLTTPATHVLYTLSLHDALPICLLRPPARRQEPRAGRGARLRGLAHRRARPPARGLRAGDPRGRRGAHPRSEEHTSELQSRENLVCRLLLEKKNKKSLPTSIYIP